MLKWIKESLFGGRSSEEYHPEHLVVKLPDISEPVISFLKTVRENPKRFIVYGNSCVIYTFMLTKEQDYSFYSIRDIELSKGWFIKGDLYNDYYTVNVFKNTLGHEEAFFLTSDEKEYLIKEISSIMNYRVERKAKLDKISADRRIRDTRNKLKELYK